MDLYQISKITELGQTKNLKAHSHDEKVTEAGKRSLFFFLHLLQPVNQKKKKNPVEKVGRCEK